MSSLVTDSGLGSSSASRADSDELPPVNIFFMEKANTTQLLSLQREVTKAKRDGKRKVAQVYKNIQGMSTASLSALHLGRRPPWCIGPREHAE